ncbi:hypothetical protein PVAND_007661 [Polypedilum vanderplanki]|uniref:Uncharacterized protein n=1 Tax=Polypedilum vanderplanki TaxID=319348 RepID=A0A9J6C706_POLVA|nr:hypothetical protein PVAND_007661 [Polypedilum vanderplanki]
MLYQLHDDDTKQENALLANFNPLSFILNQKASSRTAANAEVKIKIPKTTELRFFLVELDLNSDRKNVLATKKISRASCAMQYDGNNNAKKKGKTFNFERRKRRIDSSRQKRRLNPKYLHNESKRDKSTQQKRREDPEYLRINYRKIIRLGDLDVN